MVCTDLVFTVCFFHCNFSIFDLHDVRAIFLWNLIDLIFLDGCFVHFFSFNCHDHFFSVFLCHLDRCKTDQRNCQYCYDQDYIFFLHLYTLILPSTSPIGSVMHRSACLSLLVASRFSTARYFPLK